MSRLLPLFPLDVVLFPGARLPLHIFESRYRALLADVLAGDSRFGLVAPAPDGEAPPEGALGCVARVEAHQPLADGRANIVAAGERRFVVRRYTEGDSTPYLIGLVEEFDDEEGSGDLPGDTLDMLRRLAERCRAALGELTGLDDASPWPDDAGEFTFRVAAVMPWEAHQARRLLAVRSAAQRADLLLRVLPQIVPELELRASVHARAPTNGKSHQPADLGDPIG